ncbi:unnamed protein product [Adineta ricciae]|uniref:Uncharacterized protein n=1 Tax=Adineta ricciae TaxID=249248 RepID=A0A815VXX1_ADIRI|nr:unnamed protein product [Adineta ricciae]
MADSQLLSNTNAAELNFYRALANFSQKAYLSSDNAKACCSKLLETTKKLLETQSNISDDLIIHLATTIKMALYRDSNRLIIKEQRSIPRRTSSNVMKVAFPIIYEIYAAVGFDRFKREVDGTPLCIDRCTLFICPRPPPLLGNKYTHGQFDIPSHSEVKRIPLKNVQHAVHNINDLFSILGLTLNEPNVTANVNAPTEQGVEVHFIGGQNHAYHGPDFVWFAPQPSTTLPEETQCTCRPLNMKFSVYGSYLFRIPFRNLLRFKTYCLGTRQYGKEFCHSIMFTDKDVQTVKLEKELQSTELINTGLIEQVSDDSFDWLLHRSAEEAYDQLDFALAASDIKWNTHDSGVRLDFIDHRECVRNLFIARQTDCQPVTRSDAMQEFMRCLTEKGIELSSIKSLFDETVYCELQTILRANPLWNQNMISEN